MVSPDHVQFWAKVFPFYLLLRLIFARVACICDQCIYRSGVDHAIKHCHCPSASCSVYLANIWSSTSTSPFVVIKFSNFRLSWIAADCWIMLQWWKEDNWFVLLWDIWRNCEILAKSKNRRVFIMLPGRLELLSNFSFILLHCPKKCQFFVFQLICKVNRRKEIICCYISPACVLTRNRLNQCPDDTTCQSTSYFTIFFAQINFRIHHVFRGKITSSKFWFRTCLVLSAYIAGIHFFFWMEVIVHWCRQLNQPNTMIYTNQ